MFLCTLGWNRDPYLKNFVHPLQLISFICRPHVYWNYNWSSVEKILPGINRNPSFSFCHSSLVINAKTFNGFRKLMKALYVMQQDVESRWVLNNYNFVLAEIQRFLYSLKTSLFIWSRQCVLISLRKGMNLNKQEKKLLEGRKSLIAYGNSAVLFLQSIFLLPLLCLSSFPRHAAGLLYLLQHTFRLTKAYTCKTGRLSY